MATVHEDGAPQRGSSVLKLLMLKYVLYRGLGPERREIALAGVHDGSRRQLWHSAVRCVSSLCRFMPLAGGTAPGALMAASVTTALGT